MRSVANTPEQALYMALSNTIKGGTWVGEKKEKINYSIEISDPCERLDVKEEIIEKLDDWHGENHFGGTANWTFPKNPKTGLTGELKPTEETGEYFDKLVDSPKGNQLESMVEKINKWGRNNRTCAQVFQVSNDLNAMFPPCLMNLQAFYRDEQVHLTAYFRSHTVAKSYYGDIVALGRLQKWLVGEVDVDAELGKLTVHSGSLHIRKKNNEHRLANHLLEEVFNG